MIRHSLLPAAAPSSRATWAGVSEVWRDQAFSAQGQLTPRPFPPSCETKARTWPPAAAAFADVAGMGRRGMIESLPQRVNGDEALVRRGRFLTTTFLLEVGPAA